MAEQNQGTIRVALTNSTWSDDSTPEQNRSLDAIYKKMVEESLEAEFGEDYAIEVEHNNGLLSPSVSVPVHSLPNPEDGEDWFASQQLRDHVEGVIREIDPSDAWDALDRVAEQHTKPAITDEMVRSVAAAYLDARERYTDGRSYPVYIVIYDDGDAEAYTFQEYEGRMYGAAEGDRLGVIKVDQRPLWGSEDDGSEDIDLDMYLDAIRDDLRGEIADALAE
jgi:hypothetical protein